MAVRRASSVVFGFDFQVNAAIILMLENISDLMISKSDDAVCFGL